MRGRISFVATVAAWAMVCAASMPVRAAAPLADGVPADALLYIGWRGAETAGPAYERSHLKAIADASELTTSLRRIAPQIVAKLADADPQTGAIADLIVALGGAVWNYPTAVYFSIDPPAEGDRRPPMPKVAVIVHAGKDTEKVAAAVKQMLEGAPPDVRLATVGDGRVILTNLPEGAIDQMNGAAGAGGASLATSAAFKKSLAATHEDPVIVAYMDVEAMVARFDAMMAMQKKQFEQQGQPAPRDFEQMMKFRDLLAPQGLKRMTIAMGFEDRDWTTSMFIEAPGPRSGIAKLIEGGAIDEAALKVVPATAAMAGAGTLDMAGLFDWIRKAMKEADPREAEQFERNLAEFEQNIGMKVHDDLLAPFGKQWMYYTDAKVAGTGVLGGVLVNKLDDPAKADKALANVGEILNGMFADLIGEPQVQVRFRTLDRKGVAIHYLAIPAIAPAWAVHDGYLYIGIQPQVVAGAIDFVKSKAPSLTTSDKYNQMRATVRGGGPMTGFEYLDLPQKINDAYAVNVLLSRYLTGFGDLFGIDAPPMVVPPLSDLLPHLAPAMMVSWTDDAGIHVRQRTPFPLADLLANEAQLTIAPTAMMVGILLPSLSRAREVANRSKSAANLSGIYRAAYTYSVTHKDKFPDELATLIGDGSIAASHIIHPADSHRLASLPVANFGDPKVVKWAQENSSYVWRKGVTSAVAANEVVAHEGWHIVSDVNHHEGMNVLLGDGSVQWMSLDQAVPLIKKAKLPIPEDFKWWAEEEAIPPALE